jgi:hypothetical protein
LRALSDVIVMSSPGDRVLLPAMVRAGRRNVIGQVVVSARWARRG